MGDTHIIPRPPHRRSTESRMLDEVSDTLGLVLWQMARHLRDWADSSPTTRRSLFHPQTPPWVAAKRVEARMQTPELADALAALFALTASPAGVSARDLAAACDQVAAWAEEREHREMAIQYAEAAALVDPDSPRRANFAGRLTRNAGEYARAEVWFERGIGLARKRKDRVEYIRGHLGYGILCKVVGRDNCARRHFNTASVMAMREGHEWLAAEAQHDLFALLIVRGHYSEAEVHAQRALQWYPKHHPRFPFLVADFAFLLVCENHFTPAVTLLRGFLRTVGNPADSVIGLSVLVRAAAGSGQQKEFERLRLHLLAVLKEHSEAEAAARWNLAEAERAAGLWESAEANARAAVEIAGAQHDVETERLARSLLQGITTRTPPPAEVYRRSEDFEQLLDTFTKRLSEWAPTRRGRSPILSRSEWAA